jgi:exodeoxyribonuclease VII large subunit
MEALRDRASRCFGAQLDHAAAGLSHTLARVVSLSPQATLDRGYAVVQKTDGSVVRDAADVAPSEELRLRLSAGELRATASAS